MSESEVKSEPPLILEVRTKFMPPLELRQYFCTLVGTVELQDVKTNTQSEIITKVIPSADSVDEVAASPNYGARAANQRGNRGEPCS